MRSASAYGVFLALTLFWAQTAGAKNLCEPVLNRPAAIAGLDLHHLKALASGTPFGTGPARLRAVGEIPVGQGYGVRVEVDRSFLPVKGATGWDGMLSASHTGLGIVHHDDSDVWLCGYSALTAGVHTFAYRGHRARGPGISGTLGYNLASDGYVHPFIEISLSVIRAQSPLELYAYRRSLTGGVRFRF
jgi:hypothetical protein